MPSKDGVTRCKLHVRPNRYPTPTVSLELELEGRTLPTLGWLEVAAARELARGLIVAADYLEAMPRRR